MNSTDISIGKDKWIKWVAFSAQSINPKEIDYLLEPTKEFWNNLETECLAACCGIDAFSFWVEDIRNAANIAAIPDLEILFNNLISSIASVNDEVIVSNRMNQLMNREMFLELLEHIKKHIKST